ncbi:MAG TPA: carboxypeptidase-like regulatory domain-containing protein, partial [Armatimonadota bacterium]|nr:carboxypeptidase-like regulatory domain-containing protein [Armatimonadota bacterium]
MKHVRVLLWLAVAALAALLAGCGGGGGGGVATTAVVQGLVSDNLGAPLPGATIAVGAATATSDADGAYTLAVVPGANVKVTASRAGLTSTFKVITLTVGQTMPLNFTLIPVGKSNALANMDTTDTVADSGRGASVTLPAGSVVIEGTDTVVTDAVVEVTNAVPTDPGYAGNFPGMFVGTQNGADVAIESFGYVTITITSGGQKCNLGAGQTAEIAIPVAVGADPGTPTIPLWWLDETTGKWIHEGDAVRDATVNPVVYRATVTHFSSYNLDRPIEDAIPFTITVKR